jgi:hypothetical protein
VEAFNMRREGPGILILLILFCYCAGCSSPTSTLSSSNATIPADDYSHWVLKVNGTTHKEYTLDELRKLPSTTGYGFAVSTVGIKYGPYVCKGVLLSDLLEQVGVYRRETMSGSQHQMVMCGFLIMIRFREPDISRLMRVSRKFHHHLSGYFLHMIQ